MVTAVKSNNVELVELVFYMHNQVIFTIIIYYYHEFIFTIIFNKIEHSEEDSSEEFRKSEKHIRGIIPWQICHAICTRRQKQKDDCKIERVGVFLFHPKGGKVPKANKNKKIKNKRKEYILAPPVSLFLSFFLTDYAPSLYNPFILRY